MVGRGWRGWRGLPRDLPWLSVELVADAEEEGAETGNDGVFFWHLVDRFHQLYAKKFCQSGL